MLIWFVFRGLVAWPSSGMAYYSHLGEVLEFVLFLLLGWKVFGKPVQ